MYGLPRKQPQETGIPTVVAVGCRPRSSATSGFPASNGAICPTPAATGIITTTSAGVGLPGMVIPGGSRAAGVGTSALGQYVISHHIARTGGPSIRPMSRSVAVASISPTRSLLSIAFPVLQSRIPRMWLEGLSPSLEAPLNHLNRCHLDPLTIRPLLPGSDPIRAMAILETRTEDPHTFPGRTREQTTLAPGTRRPLRVEAITPLRQAADTPTQGAAPQATCRVAEEAMSAAVGEVAAMLVAAVLRRQPEAITNFNRPQTIVGATSFAGVAPSAFRTFHKAASDSIETDSARAFESMPALESA